MVAKVVVAVLVFWAAVAVLAYGLSRYAIPAYYDYRERNRELAHEKEIRQIERDERIVESVDNDSADPRNGEQ